jgi:hypothetical protein
MNYYKSVLSGNQTRLNFEDEDSFKENPKKCINISRNMMNWKTFSIFVKIRIWEFCKSNKLKLMRLQKKKKLKKYLHLLKKENTEILVLICLVDLLYQTIQETSVNILGQCCRAY